MLRTRSLRSSSRRCRLPPQAQPQQPSSSLFRQDDGGHRRRPSSSSSAKSCNSKVLSSSSASDQEQKKEQNISHQISLSEKSCENNQNSETSEFLQHKHENDVTGKKFNSSLSPKINLSTRKNILKSFEVQKLG